MATQFHLALPCISINKTKIFYKDVFSAEIGRSDVKWADINLFTHQITFTECGPFKFDCQSYNFNGDILPSFHFGVILLHDEWNKMLERLNAHNVPIASKVKFLEHKKGAHHSFFVKDPNDYTVEFKCFDTPSEVFES
ncbi:extradiol dioxygenase family protein [Gelidibacter sediminis]|uniref:Extradiol dioxygenase family protein n=1 Tax=Gelidibacter sediminis TaxID=1608710 RepID=A0A4V3F951_9FLAO|nr:bleomycin resistance protein [Gelidibacter sediminis]TDU42976.1 extradiol dioxygenase family protein [Gelidibacter sediminis]